MHGVRLLPTDGTWQSTSIPEAGVPGFRMLDGPKGVGGSSVLNIANDANTTAFPVPIARAATWNRDLEARVGRAIAQEARAVGADTLLAPGMNLAWHPLGGRSQEYYGEDPFLAGEIGTAFVQGVQSMAVIATAKHFTANHIEDTRLDVNVNIDERTLRETFLPQFRRVVEQGRVGAVMSAYNQLNGTYCGESPELLGDILKRDWGFAGFVVSDFLWGTHDTLASAGAGLDLEMPAAIHYGRAIVAAVTDGQLDEQHVDDHVRRIVRAQLCYELDSSPPVVDESQLETDETLSLAREVATQAIVLLRNEGGLLPLSKTAATSIVVVGPLAELENIGDSRGSSAVRSSEVVTLAEGLLARKDVAATVEVVPGDLTDPSDRTKVAAADVVIVSIGLTEEDEGEGQVRPPAPQLGAGDRDTYGLPEVQLAFLADLVSLEVDLVVVLEGGSAIDLTSWFDDTRAIVMAWYPGVRGGHAIADVLFGDANPSGKAPVAFPASLADLQPWPRDALEVTYERYHGYRRLDKNGVAPFVPFGYGLSYTTFDYTGLEVAPSETSAERALTVSFTITNTGPRSGVEVAQVYAGPVQPVVDAPVRKLVGFERIEVEAGEGRRVEIAVPVRELAHYDLDDGWVVPPGPYRIEVGPNASSLPMSVELEVR